MAPDVTDGWSSTAREYCSSVSCYEAIDLQSVRMDDGPDDSLLVTTKCELTITETMLYCGMGSGRLSLTRCSARRFDPRVDAFLLGSRKRPSAASPVKADILTPLRRLLGVFGMLVVRAENGCCFWVINTCIDKMSSELPLLEPDDAQSLLTMSWSSSIPNNGERDKKRRLRYYSPDYERCRREKKKVEREALRSEVAQYEMQVELLRTQRLIHRDDSKWGWVQSATEEEEKRRKAEKLNHQLRGLLVQQFNIAQTLRNVLTQETGFAQRVQSVLSGCPPCSPPTTLSTFPTLSSIATHLRGMLGCLHDSAEYVFESASIFDANSLGGVLCELEVSRSDLWAVYRVD
ncbi:hypothetical protein GQ600_16203 [Phytophthora cactorum]|nr:hypothetical protein GQ600_16203 [Phytophthora cactorum]